MGLVLLQNVGHNIHHQALPFLPSHLILHALPSVHSVGSSFNIMKTLIVNVVVVVVVNLIKLTGGVALS